MLAQKGNVSVAMGAAHGALQRVSYAGGACLGEYAATAVDHRADGAVLWTVSS
jgi:hypothetical protein